MRSTKSGDGTDAKWQLLLYSYDAEGRVVKKNTYTEGLPALGYVITYSYNRQGQQVFSLVKVGTSTTHQLYQWQDYQANRGLLEKATYATTSTKPASAQQSLSYDAAGLVTSRQYQGQASVPYAYNARDGLVSIGSVTSTTYPFSASYTYQRNGQVLVTDYHNKQSASVNDRYQVLHRYDGLGRLLQADYCHFALITSSACTSVNHYDVTGITYDRQGNLLTLNRRDATGTRVDSLLYGYQAGRNRLSSLTERAGASSATWDAEAGSFTCDKSGNVMTMPAPWNVSASVYDARNLPVSVSVTVGSVTTTTQYRYNAQGQRYWKKTGSSSGEFYVLDGSVVLGLFSETGARTYWNYVAGGEVFARVSGGIRKYYSKDHLGSVRAVQEETGVVIEAEDYDAWGVLMAGRSYLSGVGAKEGYTGKERDAETGLDYFGARYYLGAIGRWGAVDALTDQYPSWSPYTYVLNSPLRLVDPDGREVVIKYEEDGEEKTYKYAPGTSYDGDNEFVKTVISYLNEVSTTEVTAFIINELVGSKNTFTIVSDVNSFFTPDNTRHANIGGFVTGSGGTLHFDMSGKPLFGANGRLDEPRPDSDLLHELSHALDANRGLNDNREINSEGVLYDATSSSGVHQSHQGFLRVAEWSATYRENQYRQERGYPLRGYYISTNRGVPMPPLMLRNGQPFIPTIRSN